MAGAEEKQLSELLARLRFPLLAVLGSVLLGTVGYYLLWRPTGGSWLDALYMTIITLTTIGYGEVRPLDSTARVFTMVLAVIGVANLFYVFGVGMDVLVAMRLGNWRGRRRMAIEIERLEGHVIVIGLGRVGLEAAREIAAGGVKILAIDVNDQMAEGASSANLAFLLGDGTVDSVLEHAGVRRARSLIACTGSDATNLYVVLSARLLNPGLTIVSRVVEEASEPKLLKAGASRAISPYAMGGRRLAHLILSPHVVELFETAMAQKGETLDIEDIPVNDGELAGRTLGSLRKERANVTILCVVREGSPLVRPGADMILRAGDHVLAFGTARQLAEFAKGK